jgi:hypothetical protein
MMTEQKGGPVKKRFHHLPHTFAKPKMHLGQTATPEAAAFTLVPLPPLTVLLTSIIVQRCRPLLKNRTWYFDNIPLGQRSPSADISTRYGNSTANITLSCAITHYALPGTYVRHM